MSSAQLPPSPLQRQFSDDVAEDIYDAVQRLRDVPEGHLSERAKLRLSVALETLRNWARHLNDQDGSD